MDHFPVCKDDGRGETWMKVSANVLVWLRPNHRLRIILQWWSHGKRKPVGEFLCRNMQSEQKACDAPTV